MMTQDTTYAFTVSVGTYDMQFNDRSAADRAAAQYGATVTENWTTYQSHPASGLAYQESKAGEMTAARVVQNGDEIVSPGFDVDQIWRQYNGRVQRAIADMDAVNN